MLFRFFEKLFSPYPPAEPALPPKGFLRQEDIPLAPYLKTTTGKLFVGGAR